MKELDQRVDQTTQILFLIQQVQQLVQIELLMLHHVGAAGSEIGVARLYDFALETGSYETQNAAINQWDIALWDLQMYTTFQVNTSVTLTVPTHIKGQSSGATGFLRYSSVGIRDLPFMM